MMLRGASWAVLVLAVVSVLQTSIAHPYSPHSSPHEPRDADLIKRATPGEFTLRIMPLGASITAGDNSPPDDTGQNGYRKYLRDTLRSKGWPVNMVGNFKRGDMSDNDHEGVRSERVSQVAARAGPSCAAWLPNVVLINAGTNDATQDLSSEPSSRTGERMRDLIETVFRQVPRAVVVLSTLLPNRDAQDKVNVINDGYRQLARSYDNGVNPPKKVILADMASVMDMSMIWDGTHPTVQGEQLMAALWVWAIETANERGWISPPPATDRFSDKIGDDAWAAIIPFRFRGTTHVES